MKYFCIYLIYGFLFLFIKYSRLVRLFIGPLALANLSKRLSRPASCARKLSLYNSKYRLSHQPHYGRALAPLWTPLFYNMQDISGQTNQLLSLQGLCSINLFDPHLYPLIFGVWFRRKLAYFIHRVKREKFIILRCEFHTEYSYGRLYGLTKLISRILHRNCLLKHFIEWRLDGKGRRTRRRKELLNDLEATRRYCKVKEDALDRIMWRNHFGYGFGPVVRQTTFLWLWWRWICNSDYTTKYYND